jgi:hypothetical protein
MSIELLLIAISINSSCSGCTNLLTNIFGLNLRGDTLKQPHFAVRFATSYDEEEIMKIVLTILLHVLKPDGIREKDKGDFDVRCLL